jgi:hypothetical protein
MHVVCVDRVKEYHLLAAIHRRFNVNMVEKARHTTLASACGPMFVRSSSQTALSDCAPRSLIDGSQ